MQQWWIQAGPQVAEWLSSGGAAVSCMQVDVEVHVGQQWSSSELQVDVKVEQRRSCRYRWSNSELQVEQQVELRVEQL